jgi:hypothetical protein
LPQAQVDHRCHCKTAFRRQSHRFSSAGLGGVGWSDLRLEQEFPIDLVGILLIPTN